MANLVSPGFNNNALVNSLLAPAEERIIEFRGLNRRDYVEEGEMSDMTNLTSDNYPLLTPRKLRGTLDLPEDVVVPLKIMTRYNKICLIAKYTYVDENEDEQEGIGFFFNGELIPEIDDLTASSEMVAINTKICFFPQKTSITLLQSGESASVVENSYAPLGISETVTEPSPGTYNVELTNENVKIKLDGDLDFTYDDAININGTLTYKPSGGSYTSKTAVASCIIEAVSKQQNPDKTVLILPRETFIELTGEGADSDASFAGKIERDVPTLDMVIEWNNRLWGANSEDNIIYACKLGDPKNWHYYQGTALDSYYAQQGTDGIWTGCAAYSSHIIFFKQNGMARIYGSSPASYQITNTKCYGVEAGSRGSVVTINDKVFYKSVIGIMAYDGGIPYCISDKFNHPFRNVVGGSEGRKYYASVQTANIGPELMVLDIDRAVWHKEDSVKFQNTCSIDDKLYFVTHDSEGILCGADEAICGPYILCGGGSATSGEVHVINPDVPTETYDDMSWSATFGPFDEYVENRKIYSKILLRLLRKKDSEVNVYISIDEGAWEQVYSFSPAQTGGDYIPIIPRRCDRYSIKVEGKGACEIKSLTRKVRMGTGGRL